MADRKKLVKCEFHPRTKNHTTKDCKFKKPRLPCKCCTSPDHHSLFCDTHKSSTNFTIAKKTYITENQEHSDRLNSPVLLPFVFANVRKEETSFMSPKAGNIRLGILTDNCATDTWITFAAAEKLGLEGEDIKIRAGGFGGKEELIDSKLFKVRIRCKHGEELLECFGVETIGHNEVPPDPAKYAEMCNKFRVKPRDVKRPTGVDMLIGERDNHLYPEVIIKNLNGMKLRDGPLGKTFAGVDKSGTLGGPQLSSTFFISAVVQQPVIAINSEQIKDVECTVDTEFIASQLEAASLSKSLLCKSSKDFLDFFKEENIGVDCKPKCGNCQCGNCAIGGKLMSLKQEREYEVYRSNLEYDPVGNENDPGPYWRSKFPWIEDRTTLGDNKSVVLGTMNATLRKLNKDPFWRKTYEDQLRVLIENGFARKVSKEELDSWIAKGNKTYYISHQIVVVPDNKTTPLRVVFNSSQKFKGTSLNACLSLGPDVMNSLQGIMLRFREHKVAAAGDIRKMFYCVRIALEDQMCQLWCHQFEGSNEIETFCMTRLVMGNKPSTNISGVAMKETTKLEDYAAKYPIAREALDRNSYVDNTNTGADTHEQLKKNIEEIELVASKGGFYYKPWIVSGDKASDVVIGPMGDENLAEKNLGVTWLVTQDQLQVKPVVNVGNKRKGQKLLLTPYLGDIDKVIPLKLKLCDCLSVHAGCYDP